MKEENNDLFEFMDQKLADRFNDGKRQWTLIDFDALEDMVKVLEFGAQKYSAHNWKKGLKITGIVESLMRHLLAFTSGEDLDQESQLPHTAHILCNAMFLSYTAKFNPGMDNRYRDLNKVAK